MRRRGSAPKTTPPRRRPTARRGKAKVPKIKTRRGAAKRFGKTGGGKLRRSKTNKRHILTKKSSKRKRHLRQRADVHPVDAPRIRKTVPYL